MAISRTGRLWADIYLGFLVVAASIAVVTGIAGLHVRDGGVSLGMLLLLATATELYPLVSQAAASSLIAPILYVALLLYGWPGAVTVAAVGVTLGQVALRRSPRVILFNAAQYAIAAAAGARLSALDGRGALAPPAALLFVLGYYAASNLLGHGYLWIRGDRISRSHLKAVGRVELPSLLLASAAIAALVALQAAGDRVDPLGLAFFFLPFIGLGLVLRQAQDARLYQQQVLELVGALADSTATDARGSLSAIARALCREGSADAAVIIRLGQSPMELARWPGAADIGRHGARALGRLARMRGGTLEVRCGRPGERLQSWYVAVSPEGNVAVAAGRRRPYAYFGQMRRLVRTAATVAAATLEREELQRRQREVWLSAERARLARRVHDTLAQDLAALSMELASAERAAPGEGFLRLLLQQARGEAQSALKEVREAIVALSPEAEATDIPAALESLRAQYRTRGFNLSVELDGSLPCLPPEAAAALMRAAAEGVRNAFKYAGKEARLELSRTGAEVVLRIVDQGRGRAPGPAAGTGLGLRLLRQEIEHRGGRVDLRRHRRGAELEIAIPLPEGVGA